MIAGFEWVIRQTKRDSIQVYFHNLKFDGEFILAWLFQNGYRHTMEPDLHEKEFTTLISDTRLFYQIKICFRVGNKEKSTVTIYDSLKVIPFRVEQIPKAFSLDIKKLDLDYDKLRDRDYVLNEDEIDYLKNDCVIVGKALKVLIEQGMTKMTAAANSLNAFKQTMDKKRFRKIFPVLDCDEDLRKSYKGGYVYVNPKYQGQKVGAGRVYDVNSLYPSRMRYDKLPYGEPKLYHGKYYPDRVYPLFIQYLRCSFRLKPGHVPMIQVKKSTRFAEHEYITDSGPEEVVLCLTSVDLEIFLQHYDTFNLEFLSGYKFKASDKLFVQFVDAWMKVKEDAEKDGNRGMRTLAKLIMNSLYGKWAVSPKVISSIPYFDEELVKYGLAPEEERDPLYIPAAAFITAYARKVTLTAIQANYDRFLYADTDSIHLLGDEDPVGIDIHQTKLGAWKHEFNIREGKFLRAKCYLEIGTEPNKDRLLKNVTVAGMGDKLHKYVTLDNFELGMTFSTSAEGDHVIHIKPEDANLRPVRVKNGIVLVQKDFTLQIN